MKKDGKKIRLQREKQSSYQEKKVSGRLVELPGELFFLNFHSPPDKD